MMQEKNKNLRLKALQYSKLKREKLQFNLMLIHLNSLQPNSKEVWRHFRLTSWGKLSLLFCIRILSVFQRKDLLDNTSVWQQEP